ncbi:MAG: hypothetical protein QM749_20215 [Aquabacterium sp.]
MRIQVIAGMVIGHDDEKQYLRSDTRSTDRSSQRSRCGAAGLEQTLDGSSRPGPARAAAVRAARG